MFKKILVLLLILCPFTVFGWDGTDVESGASVEIESGNLVRTGNDIEIYDYDAGEYKYVEVESINRYGNTVELELYDYDTGDTRTVEMYDYDY
jgi:hypothetical protein